MTPGSLRRRSASLRAHSTRPWGAALDAGLDHRSESRVEDRVRGDELRPRGPWPVEVGEVRIAGRVCLALAAARGLAEGLQAAVEHARVAEVVETHGGGRDVRLQ